MTLLDFVEIISLSIVWLPASALFGMLFGFTFQLKLMNPNLSLRECLRIAVKRMYDFFGR